MRKLFLINFRFKTGEVEYSDYRNVSVHESQDAEQDYAAAISTFKAWFAEQFPESELLSVVPHSVIEQQ